MGRPRKPPPDYKIPARRKSRPIKPRTLKLVEQMHQLVIGGSPVQRAAIDVLAAVIAEHRERGADHSWLPSHKVLIKNYRRYEARLKNVEKLNAFECDCAPDRCNWGCWCGLIIKTNLLECVLDELGDAVDPNLDHPADWYHY